MRRKSICAVIFLNNFLGRFQSTYSDPSNEIVYNYPKGSSNNVTNYINTFLFVTTFFETLGITCLPGKMLLQENISVAP